MALALALTGVIFILQKKLQRACDFVEAVSIASRVATHENVVLHIGEYKRIIYNAT